MSSGRLGKRGGASGEIPLADSWSCGANRTELESTKLCAPPSAATAPSRKVHVEYEKPTWAAATLDCGLVSAPTSAVRKSYETPVTTLEHVRVSSSHAISSSGAARSSSSPAVHSAMLLASASAHGATKVRLPASEPAPVSAKRSPSRSVTGSGTAAVGASPDAAPPPSTSSRYASSESVPSPLQNAFSAAAEKGIRHDESWLVSKRTGERAFGTQYPPAPAERTGRPSLRREMASRLPSVVRTPARSGYPAR
mmetsp:Transcript_23701/g.77065  ORF Transcript_23701/g.77065 Transcript_23701/m.77065 type:complete len:253 (-) Transcript_23701:1188-1946(-)